MLSTLPSEHLTKRTMDVMPLESASDAANVAICAFLSFAITRAPVGEPVWNVTESVIKMVNLIRALRSRKGRRHVRRFVLHYPSQDIGTESGRCQNKGISGQGRHFIPARKSTKSTTLFRLRFPSNQERYGFHIKAEDVISVRGLKLAGELCATQGPVDSSVRVEVLSHWYME